MAYRVDNLNIASRQILLRVARNAGLRDVLPFMLDEGIFANLDYHNTLRENTDEAFQKGCFGVPSFWIPAREKLIFGTLVNSSSFVL